MVPDDGELVARARRDPQAFAPLYERYFEPIYRYCYRRLRSPEAAADATSLVFARAWNGLPGFRGDSFRGWLYAIAHNVVAGHRPDPPRSALEDAGEIADPAPSPEQQAIAADEGRALRALLDQLPREQRRVVELRLAGLTGPEIAVALGRTHGAVKVAQFRALGRLREIIERTAGSEGASHGWR
jgi:RNA polymerase sigma-70 factor (ECF subfamily)